MPRQTRSKAARAPWRQAMALNRWLSVVARLITGTASHSAARAASCSSQPRRCGRHRAWIRVASQASRNARISQLSRVSRAAGSNRLAAKYTAMAASSPVMEAMFKPFTRRRWKPGVLPRSCWVRLDTHSNMPVQAMALPTTPNRKNSQRVAGSAKRARCRFTNRL